MDDAQRVSMQNKDDTIANQISEIQFLAQAKENLIIENGVLQK